MPTGSCLCAAVRYRVDGPLREVVNCHCERCRRVSGVFLAATAAARADLTIDDATAAADFHCVDERIASHAGELGAADIPFTRAGSRAD